MPPDLAVHDLSADNAVAHVTEVATAALAHYPVAPGSAVQLLDLSENATFRVDEPDGPPSVLRVHRLNYHSPEAIASELSWLAALRQQAGIRTPRVLPTADGAALATVGPPGGGPTRVVVRFEFLSGTEPPEHRLADSFEALGEVTARMHQHSRGWTRPPGFTRFRWDHEAAFGPAARWGDWRNGIGVDAEARTILQRLEDTLNRQLATYGDGSERWGLIHADLRLANLLVDEADSISVIDFDDCGESWFLYDLGAAVSFLEHRPEVPELVDRWLTGYRRQHPLAAADEAEIWTFILFRRLLLVAWIGSHTGVDFARSLGSGYTADSCELAERYLSRHSMFS